MSVAKIIYSPHAFGFNKFQLSAVNHIPAYAVAKCEESQAASSSRLKIRGLHTWLDTFGHFQREPRVIARKLTWFRGLLYYWWKTKSRPRGRTAVMHHSNMGAWIYWIIIKSLGGFCRFFIQDGGLQDCAKSKHKRKDTWGLLTRLGFAYALLISSSAKTTSLYGGLSDGGLQDGAQS